jgi:hypothetical protein
VIEVGANTRIDAVNEGRRGLAPLVVAAGMFGVMVDAAAFRICRTMGGGAGYLEAC